MNSRSAGSPGTHCVISQWFGNRSDGAPRRTGLGTGSGSRSAKVGSHRYSTSCSTAAPGWRGIRTANSSPSRHIWLPQPPMTSRSGSSARSGNWSRSRLRTRSSVVSMWRQTRHTGNGFGPGQVLQSMRIDVWSDVVCPWCYIGKRRLEEALAESGDTAEIVWHSFQLDPSSTNDDPRDLPTRLGEKYGRDRAWGVQANQHVTEVAAELGLEYHLDQAKSVNTVDAHRLLHLALEQGPETQGRLKE